MNKDLALLMRALEAIFAVIPYRDEDQTLREELRRRAAQIEYHGEVGALTLTGQQ